MSEFRKKPVVIEAVSVYAMYGFLVHNWSLEAHHDFHDAAMGGRISADTEAGVIVVQTLEGIMRSEPDGWIIRGVQGEFYPITNDIFERTYEAME